MTKPKKKPWLAGLLSFLMVGMGQVYNKKYKEGILLFIIGMTFSILALTNYWLYFIFIPICVFAIYDAYKVAKKTITEEPYKHAVKITILIFVVFLTMIIAGILSYWASTFVRQYGNYTAISSEEQAEIQSKSDEFLKINEQFENKFNEVMLSLDAGDTTTARNKISEIKLLLIDVTRKLKSLCEFFSEKGLSSEYEKGLGAPCSAFIDLYDLCLPKLLDNYYMQTYVYDNAKKFANNQITKEDYVSYCDSWLNDYNVVRGSCNTLYKKANMDYSLEDLSKTCKVS